MNQKTASRTGETNVLEIVGALMEDRYWIAGFAALMVAVSVAAVMFATPVYRAQVTVVPSSDGPSGGLGSEFLGQFGGLAGLAGINVSSLRSNRAAEPYLRSNSLARDFIVENDLATLIVPDASGPENRNPPERDGALLWRATQTFTREIRKISTDAITGLITLSVEWTDPDVAAKWANTYVALANDKLRQRDLDDAERNIDFLNSEIGKTSVLGLQQAMFNLIEAEMKTVMLAKARPDYAFKIIDPAVPPEERAGPRRALVVALGGIFGVFAGVVFSGTRRMVRYLRQHARPG